MNMYSTSTVGIIIGKDKKIYTKHLLPPNMQMQSKSAMRIEAGADLKGVLPEIIK